MAKIVSLADGTVTLLPQGIPEAAARRVTLADDSAYRFAALVMSRKMANGRPIDEREALRLMRVAGLRDTPRNRGIAEDIVNREEGGLGKGPRINVPAGKAPRLRTPSAPSGPTSSEAQAAYITAHPVVPAAPVPVPTVVPSSATYTTTASPPAFPKVIKSWTDGGHSYETRQLSEGYVNALGEGAERLASMALARKLKTPEPITPMEAAEMVRLSGMPDTRGGRMLTERILAASADELGKGGVVGHITHAASQVAKKVIVPATRVMAAAAPILNKIPVIGPAVGAAVTAQYNVAQALSDGGIKKLTEGGVTGLVGKFAGGVAAIAGAGAQGVVEAPGTIASDVYAAGQWVGGEAKSLYNSVSSYLGGDNGSGGFFSSLVNAGRSLVGNFDASVASAIESVNPSLSGQLSSIFHGLGSEYAQFQHVFDSWSASMKGAPTGTAAVGKINGNLYSMVKDLAGNISVHQTPVSSSPVSAGSIPEGSLTPASQMSGFGTPTAPAGAGYGPGYSGSVSGVPVNPAGISLPGGPINPADDPTSAAMLAQLSRQANAGKSPDFQMAGFPLWAVAGLGVVALAALLKGGPSGPTMSMGQGWQLPVGSRPRRYGRNPKRRKRR